MVQHGLGQGQLLEDLVVPLEELDGVPPLLFGRQVVDSGLFDVGQGVLHRAGKGVHGNGGGLLGGFDGGLCGGGDPVALQGGDLDYVTAQLPAQFLAVDLVAVLPHHVHHVHGHHHRDAQLGQLGGQVEVAL